MRKKISQRRKFSLEAYKKNENVIKGRLFEVVLKELVTKSGFTQEHLPQSNAKDTKLHGRSTLHQIDVKGVFRLGIPFINPLLLIGEAKNFKRKVTIKEAREFLGMFIDLTQYSRIETRANSIKRTEQTLQPRYTYCPVYFSLKGYQESAQHFMYAHGINYFSYENSEIMNHLDKDILNLLAQIRSHKLDSRDFIKFNALESINDIPFTVKKPGFDRALKKLNLYLKSVNSYVGVLDRRFPIHILTRNKIIPKKPGEVKLEFLQKNSFVIKTLSNRKIGQFSLPSTFVSSYIRLSKKQKTTDNIFTQIDIVVPTIKNLLISNLKIENESRSVIIGYFEKLPQDLTQIQSQMTDSTISSE